MGENKTGMNKKMIAIIAGIVAVIAIVGGVLYYNSQPSVRYQKAQNAYANKNYEKALKYYTLSGDYLDSASKASEVQTILNYQIATNKMQNGNYDEAAQLFEELGDYEDSASQLQECKYQVGLQYMEAGQYEDAVLAFNDAPKIKDAIVQIGDAFKAIVESGDYDKAVELAEKVRNADNYSYVRYAKGQVYFKNENFKDAYNQFNRASGVLDSGEMYKEAKYQYGSKLLDRGEYTDAKAAFKDIAGYKDSDELKDSATLMLLQDKISSGELSDAQKDLENISADLTYKDVSVAGLKESLANNQEWVDMTGEWKSVSGQISSDCAHDMTGRSQGMWYRDVEKGDYNFDVTCKLLDDGKVQVSFDFRLPVFTNWSVLSAMVNENTIPVTFKEELSASDLGSTYEINDYTTATISADSIQINYKMVEPNKDAYFTYTYKTTMTFQPLE